MYPLAVFALGCVGTRRSTYPALCLTVPPRQLLLLAPASAYTSQAEPTAIEIGYLCRQCELCIFNL